MLWTAPPPAREVHSRLIGRGEKLSFAQIRATQYVIAALVGDYPENLAKDSPRNWRGPAGCRYRPPAFGAGLPIDRLRRRPDIQEAERQLASATALIGVATLSAKNVAFLPRSRPNCCGGKPERGQWN